MVVLLPLFWPRLCSPNVDAVAAGIAAVVVVVVVVAVSRSFQVEDIRAANCRANCRSAHRTLLQACGDWVRNKKGGFSYFGIPHR